MKGHCEIRLQNKITKRYRKIDADNLVTNAWKYRMNALIMKGGYSSAVPFLPIAETILGGVMLFDSTLPENVNNVMFPASAHLVGYGNRESDTTDPMRGTFNSLESGRTDQGYTLTWDFSTSQCNDTIVCVALTGVNAPTALRLGLSYDKDTIRVSSPLYHDGQYYYASDVNVGRLWINRREWPYDISVHSAQAHSDTIYGPLKDIDVSSDFPYEQIYGTNFNYDETGFATLWDITNQEVSGSYTHDLWFARLDMSDMSYVPKTTVQIPIPQYALNKVVAAGGYLYVRSNDSTKLWRISISNPLDVQNVAIDGKYDQLWVLGYLPNGVVAFQAHDTTSPYSSSDQRSWKAAYVYPDGEVRYVNRWGTFGDGIMTGWSDVLAELPDRVNLRECYLGTICNLSSPVTKTAATTMKVIYTLTDV